MALLYAAGAALAVIEETVVPDARVPWPWVAWVVVLCALTVAAIVLTMPSRLPALVWPLAAGVVPVALILVMTLSSRDASAGAQLTFTWPVMYAAYQMRAGMAWMVTGLVVVAVVVLSLFVRPPDYIEDATATPIVLIALTLTLTRARGKLDQAMTALRYSAEHDALTDLATRGRFDADLRSTEALPGPVSLLLVDIDGFKLVNDGFGHDAGDEVLKYVARSLNVRRHLTDTAYRLGGDEMAVLLPGCPEAVALARAEAIRKMVECHLAAEVLGSTAAGPVTVSVGVATKPGPLVEELGLLRAADEAMYVAKKAGRNQVATATSRRLRGARRDTRLLLAPAVAPRL